MSNIPAEQRLAELEAETKRLRAALSRVVANLGNGSAASPDASLDFLCAVPHEVKLYVQSIKNQNQKP